MAPVVPASSLDDTSRVAVQHGSNPSESSGKQYVIIDGVRYVVENTPAHNAWSVYWNRVIIEAI